MPGYNNIVSFDKYISYPIANKVVPYLRNTLDLTPNGITLINFFLRILILYYYSNIGKFNLNMLLFCSLTNIIDCFDGHMARKYNMKTKHGKYLDIYLDNLFFILLVIITFKNYKFNKNILYGLLIIMIIFFLSYEKISKKTGIFTHIEMNGPIIYLLIYFFLNKN